MLECDGFKMCRGTGRIVPLNGIPPFERRGTWLYKPEHKCWYCEDETGWCASFPEVVVSEIREE